MLYNKLIQNMMAVSAYGLILLSSCSHGVADKIGEVDSDTIVQIVKDTIPARTGKLASASDIQYEIKVVCDSVDGKLTDYEDLYADVPGHFLFRKNLKRNAAYEGTVKGRPSSIEQVWMYETGYNSTKTSLGTWGGGTGWTGQPLYVEWSDTLMDRFRKESPALTADFARREIIVGSLCGQICFINFETGKESRTPLDAGNPVKGTVSLDPTLNGNLYVGQGIPANPQIGHEALNIFSHERTYFSGRDAGAWRGWGAYDSNPLLVGGFLFWPGENGTIYKYHIAQDGRMVLHSYMRYKAKGKMAAGVENSMCVYKNLGFFGDNRGDILCIDLNTLEPLWHYDVKDDIDASIVCEVVNDMPFIYIGCEVDLQGNDGISRFVKLNGLTGELVWEQQFMCRKFNSNDKHYDGGFYGTPLLGTGNCKDLIFATVCQHESNSGSRFTAFNRTTGEVVYQTPLKYFSWSSPVSFVNECGEMFIFTGDSAGNGYLIDARTGEIIFTSRLGNVLESSAVVVGDELVIGSRGRQIYKFRVKS